MRGKEPKRARPEWVNSYYYKWFPKLLNIRAITDKKSQIEGIDVILEMDGEDDKSVDEKIRNIDYGDVLLEEFSNYETKARGWTWDPKKRNRYVSYIVDDPNVKLITLIDAFALRKLWSIKYREWAAKYQRCFGTTYDIDGNVKYQTSNLSIPYRELSLVIVFTNIPGIQNNKNKGGER